eukprot:m.5425 g.5425  ORF g.5425 m.5425 type:complete len:551 (-) comp2402_c0_seq1:170-1822(-)
MEAGKHHKQKGELYKSLLLEETDADPFQPEANEVELRNSVFASESSNTEGSDNYYWSRRGGKKKIYNVDYGNDNFEDDDFMPSRPKCDLVKLSVGWFGLSMLIVAWGVVMLPSQVRSTVGNGRAGLGLATVVVVGSIFTVIVTPLIGYFSDKTTIKMGKRRPWMIAGTVLVVLSMVFLGLANPHKPIEKANNCDVSNGDTTSTTTFPTTQVEEERLYGSLWVLVAVYAFATIGYQLVGTPYTGLLADKTPRQQRGFGSGVTGILSVLGSMAGASVGFLFQTQLTVLGMYGILSVLLVFSITIVVLSQKEDRPRPIPRKEKINLTTMQILKNYISPLFDHDFRYVFFTRFLMQQGVATVLFFLELYLHDVVTLPDNIRSESAVGLVLLPLFSAAAISSIVAGTLSDRFGGRRKVFVISSALLMSASSLLLTTVKDFGVCFVISTLFGIGYGAFVSVDFALALDCLPNKKDSAKDLAIWHQSLVLPQLIATPIGGALRDGLRGSLCKQDANALISPECNNKSCLATYVVLFCITAGYFLLSAIFVRCIKKVR